MKESYLEYPNQKVVVSDDKKGLLIYDSTDNTNDILITENIIENLEKVIQETITSIAEKKKKIRKIRRWDKISWVLLLIIVLLIIIGIYFIQKSITLVDIVCTVVLFLCKKDVFDSMKQLKKELHGLDVKLEETDKTLQQEEKKLLELKQDKTLSQEVLLFEPVPKKIEYKEQLQQIKEYLELNYHVGVKEDEYLKYYQEGTLRRNLREEGFDNKKIEKTENVLKKTLSKKKENKML